MVEFFFDLTIPESKELFDKTCQQYSNIDCHSAEERLRVLEANLTETLNAEQQICPPIPVLPQQVPPALEFSIPENDFTEGVSAIMIITQFAMKDHYLSPIIYKKGGYVVDASWQCFQYDENTSSFTINKIARYGTTNELCAYHQNSIQNLKDAHCVFLLLTQPNHDATIEQCLKTYGNQWLQTFQKITKK